MDDRPGLAYEPQAGLPGPGQGSGNWKVPVTRSVSGPARAYHQTMPHLSDWQRFDPSDRRTYPKVDAPVQVKFNDGKLEDGDSRMFFPIDKLLPCSSIDAWRYIKQRDA